MKKLIGLVFGLTLLFASQAFAQTATQTKNLAWTQPGATAAEAQAMTYKYYPDGSTTGTTLSGVTCTGTTTVTCQTGFPAFTPGTHTLTLSATNIAGEGPKSTALSFTFVVLPQAPTNLTIN